MTTTLNEIKKELPCKSGWERLLRNLNKTQPDDEPVTLTHILESNGIEDAIWCLRCVDGIDKEIRLFAVACAREVQHLMTDQNSIDTLDVAERFAKGEATKEELNVAREAAWEAARKTDSAMAEITAWTVARTTASAAAWATAKEVAKEVTKEKQKELFISFFGGKKENA